MAIENISATYGASLYGSQKGKAKEGIKKSSAFVPREEKVEISNRDQKDETSALKALIANTPDVRIQLVEDIKAKIKTNDYPIEGRLDETIRKMIQDENLF